MSTQKCAPCPARSTLGDHANAQCFDSSTWRDAGRRRRAQHRADVARILDVVEQQAEVRRCRGLRTQRRDDGEHADVGRQHGELGQQFAGTTSDAIRVARRERAHAGARERLVA